MAAGGRAQVRAGTLAGLAITGGIQLELKLEGLAPWLGSKIDRRVNLLFDSPDRRIGHGWLQLTTNRSSDTGEEIGVIPLGSGASGSHLPRVELEVLGWYEFWVAQSVRKPRQATSQ